MFPELHRWDLIGKIAPILHPNGHYIIDPEDGKIKVPKPFITTQWDAPWVHIRQDDYRFCKMYQDVFVRCLNMIPKKCVNCWKVVFRPQHIADMFNMMRLMKRLVKKHRFACKLGCEQREWTSGIYGKMGLWGCYWYNDSKEQGIFCWEKVKDAIAEDETLKHLLEDVDDEGYPLRLVLKRGCTEFEVGSFGDSINWNYSEEAAEWERIVWDRFEAQDFSREQSEDVQRHVMVTWFKHAHHAGDQSIRALNEGDMVWRSTRYYHKELYESVQKKRAVAKKLKNGGKK